MVNAFKHIRLSGYNLIPQNVNGNTRLTLNSSGVAYYSELTGVSGYLQGLINTANADVSSINGLQNSVNVSGRDGIQIFVEGQNIVVSGNNAAVQSLITNLTTNLALTGSNLNTKIDNLSGYAQDNFSSLNASLAGLSMTTSQNLAAASGALQADIDSLSGYTTGSFASVQTSIGNLGFGISSVDYKLSQTGAYLDDKIDTLSGNLNSTGTNLQGQINSLSGNFVTFTGNLAASFATDAELLSASGALSSRLNLTGTTLQNSIGTLNNSVTNLSGSLNATGSALNSRINSLSGTLTSDYVQKATQQQFIVNLPTNIESTGITFPVAFASTPNSVQVTFEPSTDVSYMVAVKNRTTAGFTAEFSDVILEAGNKLNVFASI